MDSPDEITISSQKIELVRKVFDVYGKQAKKLKWSNSLKLSPSDVVDALNLLPNLETLEFSEWPEKFYSGGKIGELKAKNLKSLEVEDTNLKFLAEILPKNSIEFLKMENVKDLYLKFFESQKNIKTLVLRGDFHKFGKCFKVLKLEKFVNILENYPKEVLNESSKFLDSFLASQAELKEIQLATDNSYGSKLINDQLLAKISQISNLESLFMSFDGISKINSMKNLKNLKRLSLVSNYIEKIEVFRQLSEIKLNSIEILMLHLWFEIPSEFYQNFAQNFPNLKSLKISLHTYHKINFYAQTFPNLEEISVHFGEANLNTNFSNVFETETGIFNEKIKKANWSFGGGENVKIEEFIEMLKMFPNLENLSISSNFPVNHEYIEKLTENLGKIKILKLRSFSTKSDEKFPQEFKDSLKNLAGKLKFISLNFHHAGKVMHNTKFSFDPFEKEMGEFFRTNSHGFCNNRTHLFLELTAGREN